VSDGDGAVYEFSADGDGDASATAHDGAAADNYDAAATLDG
jgi:hypothetical protein